MANTLAKATLLLVYVFAALSFAITMPDPIASTSRWIAVALLVAHVFELPLCWNSLARSKHGLPSSVGLALLFGLFHWLPLRQRKASS